METIQKEMYEAPSAMVFEVVHKRVICASEVEGTNSIRGWGNGGTTDDEVYM